MKTLVIFDFDDTLFESESHVIVKSPTKGIRYLTSGEYASFQPDKDDVLDFSQFEGYPHSPKPIQATINKLRQAVNKYGIDNVIILTARGVSAPITEVLSDFSLPLISVAAVGSSNPQTKAEYVVRTLQEEDYDRVIVFEDNLRNILAIKSAVVPIVGAKNFSAYNVRQHQTGHFIVRH